MFTSASNVVETVWVPSVPLNVQRYRARRNARVVGGSHHNMLHDGGLSAADMQRGDY